MKLNCLLAGVGGQGTVLASRVLAQTAISRELPACTAETIGMAQRGGCVISQVRIGTTDCGPIIPLHQADLLLGFEPAEALRKFLLFKGRRHRPHQYQPHFSGHCVARRLSVQSTGYFRIYRSKGGRSDLHQRE